MTGKGILKYLAYVFIGVWMFLLGIMVGRGTAPISFDTSGLNERLASVVKDKSEESDSKVELGFYEALDQPNDPDVLKVRVKPRQSNLLEKQKMDISLASDHEVPGETTSYAQLNKETPLPSNLNLESENSNIILKKAKKSETLNRAALNKFMAALNSNINYNQDYEKPVTTKKYVAGQISKKAVEKLPKSLISNKKESAFTIQLASFKDEKDAATYISKLNQKGINAIVEKTTIEGKSWNRVRLGNFKNHQKAKERLLQLKKIQIDGFVIKRKDGKK